LAVANKQQTQKADNRLHGGDMGRVAGKVALVTGAASGLGRATAIRLAEEGARVMVTDWEDRGGAETVDLIKAAGGEARFRHQDVSC
jgi:NAD(P)-dependent dehydrogenase (short-subunit alcohol dehydrogenase family)